ncbi:hypothetical protein AADZ91_18165 [Colwelliaceae bacterium 6441]
MTISSKELQSLNLIGEQVKKCLIEIVNKLPANVKTIRGMGIFLNYNNSNCQRVLKTINHQGNGLSAICLIPGISALQDFILKTKPFLEDKAYQQYQQTIESLSTAIKQNYGSHAKLKRFITNSQPQSEIKPTQSALSKRKEFFYSAKKLLDSSVDELFTGHIVTENTEDKRFLHEIAMISKSRIFREKKAAPCVLFYTHPQPAHFLKPSIITKNSVIQGRNFQVGVVNEYSTSNLLDFYANFSPSNLGLVFNDIPNENPFDATFLFSNPDEMDNPLEESCQCSSTFISIKSPTKKLTMVVFLERKIDMCSSVNIGCYHSTDKVEDKRLRDSDEWTKHLPGVPELRIINFNSIMGREDVSAKAIEYSNYMFNYAQLNPQDFVCYFMEVDYPIWSSTYRIYFDHS